MVYELPPDLRQLILQQNGSWSLAVLETGLGKLQALKILRQSLGWSIPEVAQARQLLPSVVISGTHAEMARFDIILTAAGLKTKVDKLA
jgi:hypothetical protein